MKKTLILVSGPQGSGKSTQAEAVAKRLGAPIFEAGVELRAWVDRREPGSAEIEGYMKRGELVPHHYVDDLFSQFFARNTGETILVSDGYPRNLPELTIAEGLCQNDNRQIIGVNVDLDETTAIERIITRAQQKSSDGDARPDNTPTAIKERLRLYHEETLPVLNRVKTSHRLFVINGAPPIEAVTKDIQEDLSKVLDDEA